MRTFQYGGYLFGYDDKGRASVALENQNGMFGEFTRCSALDFDGIASMTVHSHKPVAFIWDAKGEAYRQRIFTEGELKTSLNPFGFPVPLRMPELDFDTTKAEQRAMAFEAARKERELKQELDAAALREQRRAAAEAAVAQAKAEEAEQKGRLTALQKETAELRKAAGEFAPEPAKGPNPAELAELARNEAEAKRRGRRI